MGFISKKEKINGKAFIVIALLVFLVSGAWGACLIMEGGGRSTANGCTYGYGDCQETNTTYSCSARNPNTGANLTSNCSVSFGGGTKICIPQEDFTCQYERGTPLMILASFTYLKCNTQCELDSLACVNSGKEWTIIPGGTCNGKGCLEQCDSTYHCESVYTENNVVRSNITLTDCHGDVLQERQVLGSCSENGFCEGDEVAGSDSCSYPEPDPDKCKFGGQNGSLCTYVCPDGKLHSCRIAWTPGQPSEYQNCPQKPPTDCVVPASSSSAVPDDSIPDYPTFTSSSSSSPVEPDPDCPECDLLDAILDTLHRANEQRRYQNYVVDSIKNDVGGFGVKFDAIAGNTRGTVTSINTSNGLLGDIKSTNKRIADKLDELDLDDITATVDSVVVHVNLDSIGGGSQDSISPPPWVFFDLDSLPVWRDTVSRIHRTQERISEQIDSLTNDSTNAITKYLPFLKKVSDKLDDMTRDCEGVSCFYRPVIDTLVNKMYDRFGLDTVSPVDENDIKDKIIPIDDSTYIDGNFYCEEHPGADVCVEIDSTDLPELLPPDSLDVDSFFKWQDSVLKSNKDLLDSMKKRDSTPDTLGLDELAGDSAKIREKLDFLFLPQNTLEQCFDFRLNTTLGKWTYNLFIDFADLFGLDLCDLIRKIVRILTFILIVFTTIKGYIRAFGGGGPGGG